MLTKIIREPGSGKTKELLEYALSNDCAIVCKNPDDMRSRSFEYGYVGLTFIPYDEFLNRTWAYQSVSIVVDDADDFLEAFGNVRAFTMSA